MKTLSKICVVSLACLTACFASAETSQYKLYGATEDLFFVGSDPLTDLSVQALENCRTGGGMSLFEKSGLFLNENANTGASGWDGKTITDLVFDPIVNDTVPRWSVSNESQQLFYRLTRKLHYDDILINVMRDNGSLVPVTSAFKDEYLLSGYRYDYVPGKNVEIDLKSQGVRTIIALYSLHNKIILATEQKNTCSPEFIESAWVEASQEVASLKNCTVKFNSAVPFAAKATDLTCDGHKFVILGASE